MRQKKTRYCFLFLFLLLYAGNAYTADKLIFSGIIRDAVTHETLPYATVLLEETRRYSAIAGDDGTFRITDVFPGIYKLTVSFIGYGRQQRTVELKKSTYNLTRMNLVMRGILPDNIKVRNGDTLEEDWPDFEDSDPIGTYEPLYVDAVTSNPPYSQKWDPTDKGNDPRYADYGTAPKGKADYAFLLHDLYHIKPDGIMTIIPWR